MNNFKTESTFAEFMYAMSPWINVYLVLDPQPHTNTTESCTLRLAILKH